MEKTNGKVTRNISIDILKIICMFEVIIAHVIKAGGIIAQPDHSYRYCLSYLTVVMVYCCVDIYALITGYLLVESRWRLSQILNLWLEVEFYSVGTLILFLYFFPEYISENDRMNSFFPILSNTFWFFTSYISMYLLIPFVNALIHVLNRKQHDCLCYTLLILLSVTTSIVKYDIFHMNDGYCMIWLLSCYIIGARFRRYGFIRNCTKIELYLVYIISVYITWALVPRHGNAVLSNNSPLVFICAIVIFQAFLQTQRKVKKLYQLWIFMSKFSLATYIIHTHPLLWDHFVSVWFAKIVYLPTHLYFLHIFIYSAIVILSCSFTEIIRTKLFQLLGIFKFTKFISDKFEVWWRTKVHIEP